MNYRQRMIPYVLLQAGMICTLIYALNVVSGWTAVLVIFVLFGLMFLVALLLFGEIINWQDNTDFWWDYQHG